MNLSRSDKIIAIVGVIILIIAAIGIFIYYQTYEEPEEVEVEPLITTYDITWAKGTGDILIGDSLYAGRQQTYNELITVTSTDRAFTILTDVEFHISWMDDKTVGILRFLKRGKDTLTASITPSMGGEGKGGESKWYGNLDFPFSVYDMPTETEIEAEDVFDAEEKIRLMYTDQDSADFDVTVDVKPGEKIRRPLKYLGDKGNTFYLNATYTYYYPIIEEIPSTDDGLDEDGDDETEDDTTTGDSNGFLGICRNNILNMGYGRGWL
jgi:hypothetical protein